MAETPQTGNGEAQEPKQPKMQILGQFVRDLSFENIAAQTGVQGEAQPEISVQVGLDARKRPQDHQYDVIVKLNISSKIAEKDQQIFVLELDYCGVFHVENVPDEQLHPFLMIECPRNIFPFIRRIVHDITRDGGYPPLNLDNIDFLQIYRQQVTARAQAEKDKAAAAEAESSDS